MGLLSSGRNTGRTPNPNNTQAALTQRQQKAMRQDAGAAAGRGRRAV
jgi:hypothetical protein